MRVGLVPHSEAWFAFWEDKFDRLMDGEAVDMRGFTLAVTDRIIERADRAEQARISMRAIVRRLARPEQSRTPIAHLRDQHIADVLWERRQRRLQAGGLPFETVKPDYPPGPRMSYAESLRSCLQERRARQRAERETADNGA